MITAPFGEWKSPITAADVASARTMVSYPHVIGDEVWWQEIAPSSGGRTQVMHRAADRTVSAVLPAGYEARTRVHEYGGKSYLPIPGVGLVFANHQDQRLYLLADDCVPLTPDDGGRYADFALSPDGTEVWCVREVAADPPERSIVAVPLAGGDVRELVNNGDFLAFPTPSPDGSLAWICWNRPDMPWDSAELWIDSKRVIGGRGESVLAPIWRSADSLYVISDRSGWSNPYEVDRSGTVRHIHPASEEFAGPLWALGGRPYDLLPDGRLVVLHGRGELRLGILDPDTGSMTDVPTPYTSFAAALSVDGYVVTSVGYSPDLPAAVVRVDLISGHCDVVRAEAELVHASYFPSASPVEFTGEDGVVHGFLYPPSNPDFRAPDGELPPYVLWIHGGPTDHATSALDAGKAYFTSRGIGVLDLNYGGSSGYGRAYRDRLLGNWGITDVADAVTAARALVADGRADSARLGIKGGSAGGWTVLVAATRSTVFSAGVSYFGVSDLQLLVEQTHDFEAGCLDSLVGPPSLYRERSPLGHVTSETCPLLLLQGLLDPVVPPSQAVALLGELAEHGVEHAYLAFAKESHGFRRPESIRASLEAELAFYGRVFGFSPG
ncbi:prolyl oligopeptidase family serine peptidase [Kibdelosporangium philippinense]|uniref:Prolyl oligopeptidase family serine peptidase n=1 Tax=Kibdelosporangium philippinense TaxID=211113 RepID=A0ABS8ZSS2_9PSEU|nr:prolyl oligopeptidase family serine peptidase [Kibdelosporangium philippinense]MCE7010745.1 prolyl oligopeptidase family serine peptidase [Kibdelosporangium philippinense]